MRLAERGVSKGSPDLDRYIGEFQAGRIKLIEMGVPYSEAEMVHQILRGLSSTTSRTNFKQLLTQVVQDHLDRTETLSSDAPADMYAPQSSHFSARH